MHAAHTRHPRGDIDAWCRALRPPGHRRFAVLQRAGFVRTMAQISEAVLKLEADLRDDVQKRRSSPKSSWQVTVCRRSGLISMRIELLRLELWSLGG